MTVAILEEKLTAVMKENEKLKAALAAAGVEEMVREAIAEYRGSLVDALLRDFENGVPWLNSSKADAFSKGFPALSQALETDLGDAIVREVMGK